MITSRGQRGWAVFAGRRQGGGGEEGGQDRRSPSRLHSGQRTEQTPEVHPKPESQKRHSISMVTLHLSQQESREDVLQLI